MFGENEYWWVGLLIFAVFILLNLAVFLLRRRAVVSHAIAYGIALYLLIYKAFEIIYWQSVGQVMNFPVEFSAISYLLFAIFVVFRFERFDAFPVFAAILAGLTYSVAFWCFPDLFISGGQLTYWRAVAILNHHLLYFGGMLMLANVRSYDPRRWYQHFLGIGLIVGYSWVIHLFTGYSAAMGKPIIIQITDGSILYRVFSEDEVGTAMIAVYYALALAAFAIFLAGFYLVGGVCARRRFADHSDL